MKPTLILSLAAYDCKSKFAGSVLGGIWAFVSPIITVGIYWFVYTIALKGTPINGVPYVLWLITGIVPWFFFADGLCGAAACFWDYRFLVRKIKFKSEYLPLVRIMSAFFVHLLFIAVTYLLIIPGGIDPSFGQLLIFYWVIGGFLLTLGLGKIASVLCVYLKDLKYGINIFVQLGFWITPIFWSPSALPEQLVWLCRYNPAAILVHGYREALLCGQSISLSEQILFWIIVSALYLLSMLMMHKLKPTLADRL